ncbi:MAG: S26 family signal peptidase [Pseudomonadota bacterium]
MARLAPIVTAVIACSALALAPFAKSNPTLVWNASPSVPMGLYVIERRQPGLGEIAVLRPPEWAATIADQRRYLPMSALLLKTVAAGEGDVVCRFGRHVFVNGRLRARALRHDKMRRPLPTWQRCFRLCTGQIFMISERKDSFDSRYFGIVEQGQVLGAGRLIFSVR